MKLHHLAVAGIVSAGILAGIFAFTGSGPEQEAARNGCGVERWAVKTLTDPLAASVNLTPATSSVADLAKLPKAPKNATGRLPQEMQAFHIDAQLRSVKLEADGDFHLVLDSGGQSMIAEAPDPACASGSLIAAEIGKVRQQIIMACGQPSASSFKPCPHDVWITGVAFLDFLHGQTGVAPNGVELHPILDLYVTK